MSLIIQQNRPETQIAAVKNPAKQAAWLCDLKQSITTLPDLFAYLHLDSTLINEKMQIARAEFALRAPLPYLDRIEKGNLNDPLLRQILADPQELNEVRGFCADPLQEQNNKTPMLLHKYQNRALLLFKTACAIHCRYCFRRHFPYDENKGDQIALKRALKAIEDQTALDEIILSGGDPMMAKDHEIDRLLTRLEAIPHLKRLRIHSRLLVVIPNRITDFLCARFKQSRLKIIVVTHINHPNEIDRAMIAAITKLKNADVTLLNQAVLLKGVNDEVNCLRDLSLKLFDEAHILPYYLHLLDKVQGAAHFYVDDERAKTLMRALSAALSGFLLPVLAREIGGETHKRRIDFED